MNIDTLCYAVTAMGEDAHVKFGAGVQDRIVVRDEVHVRIDVDTQLRPR